MMVFNKGCSCDIPMDHRLSAMVFVKYSQFTHFECVMAVSDHINYKYVKYYFRALGILTVPLLALQWPRWDHLQVDKQCPEPCWQCPLDIALVT